MVNKDILLQQLELTAVLTYLPRITPLPLLQIDRIAVSRFDFHMNRTNDSKISSIFSVMTGERISVLLISIDYN